jgi:hypothetical protein
MLAAGPDERELGDWVWLANIAIIHACWRHRFGGIFGNPNAPLDYLTPDTARVLTFRERRSEFAKLGDEIGGNKAKRVGALRVDRRAMLSPLRLNRNYCAWHLRNGYTPREASPMRNIITKRLPSFYIDVPVLRGRELSEPKRSLSCPPGCHGAAARGRSLVSWAPSSSHFFPAIIITTLISGFGAGFFCAVPNTAAADSSCASHAGLSTLATRLM